MLPQKHSKNQYLPRTISRLYDFTVNACVISLMSNSIHNTSTNSEDNQLKNKSKTDFFKALWHNIRPTLMFMVAVSHANFSLSMNTIISAWSLFETKWWIPPLLLTSRPGQFVLKNLKVNSTNANVHYGELIRIMSSMFISSTEMTDLQQPPHQNNDLLLAWLDKPSAHCFSVINI